MFIERRRFLKMLPITAAGLLIRQQLSYARVPRNVPIAQIPGSCKSYGGSTLAGWEMALGDGNYACSGETPVEPSDIETAHEDSYSELRANIHHRKIMAHNINFYKIIDDETAWEVTHICGFKFRLPYIPQQDTVTEPNGQTVEGGIFIWDGKRTQQDYGTAFQWVINPWAAEFGYVNAWSNEGWKKVGDLDPVTEALKWHEVTLSFDYSYRTTTLSIDGRQYPSFFTAQPKNWEDPHTTARLQAEIISLFPNCQSSYVPYHYVEIKDWFWAWACKRVFLPITVKPQSMSD